MNAKYELHPQPRAEPDRNDKHDLVDPPHHISENARTFVSNDRKISAGTAVQFTDSGPDTESRVIVATGETLPGPNAITFRKRLMIACW